MSEDRADSGRELIREASREATEALSEQLDRELRGAWRAGYTYLHVYEPVGEFGSGEQFSVSFYVHPSDSEPVTGLRERRYLHSYELGAVDTQTVRDMVSDAE